MKKIYLFKMFLMVFVLMLLGGVNASAEKKTSTLTFTGKCGGSGTADDNVEWTVTSDADETNFDKTKGIHYGSNSKAVSYLTLKTSGISGTISKIVVNATGASKTSAKLDVTVGGSTFGSQKSLTSAAADYTFKGSASGEIVVKLSQTSATKALYVKSISVTYESSSTSTPTTAVIFDFTANPNVWGIVPGPNTKSNTDGEELAVDGVVLTTTSGSGSKTCIFSGTSGIDLRVYTGGTLTFTAPEDYTISKIVFTGTVNLNTEVEVGTLASKVWTKITDVNSVVFTGTETSKIETAAITLVPTVENKTLVATDKEAYYSTFSCDRDVVFTEDVNVYAVNVTGGTLELTALTKGDYKTTNSTTKNVTNGYYVPANTGVLISAKNANITYYTAATGQEHASLPNNQLVAATTNGKFTGDSDHKYYKLAYDDYVNKTGLGFYYGEADGAPFVVKKGLAYLAVPVNGSKPAAGYAFGGNGGDDTTGINGIENDNVNETQTIYNLQGQRVEKAGLRGIYIVNGKKVVLK